MMCVRTPSATGRRACRGPKSQVGFSGLFFAGPAWRDNNIGESSSTPWPLANAFEVKRVIRSRARIWKSLTSRTRPWVHSASDQRIFSAFVQTAHSVAVELLLIDSQVGLEKKIGWKLLDRETDGIRGARKASVPNGLMPPPCSARDQLRRAPGRDQLRRCGVVKRGHFSGPSVCKKKVCFHFDSELLKF